MKNWILLLLILGIGFYIFNHKNEPITLSKDTKILAFGDSLTYGIGAKKGSSYPEVLSRLLGLEVISSGVPGEVSANGLKRLKQILKKVNPDILILCHGGNDILRKYDPKITKENLKSMIQIAQDRGIRVILVGVPRWKGFLGIGTAKIYDELADELNIDYEDEILEKIENNPALKYDQVHPNTEGYELMAKAIKKVLLDE